MKRIRKWGLRTAFAISAVTICLFLGRHFVGGGLPLVTVNVSPSIALGGYIQTPFIPPRLYDIVGLDVPATIQGFVDENGGELEVLLKRVRATSGMRVCFKDGGVFVADQRVTDLPGEIPSEYRSWPHTCKIVGANELFLLGDSNADGLSFDSRFYGLVNNDEARRYVRVF